jgi:hypothetical protein
MTRRQVGIDDLKGLTVEDVLRQVAAHREVLTVQLPEGETVTIQPSRRLKPLPALEGSIPKGWKDAIYE